MKRDAGDMLFVFFVALALSILVLSIWLLVTIMANLAGLPAVFIIIFIIMFMLLYWLTID